MKDVYGLTSVFWEIPPGWDEMVLDMVGEMNEALAEDGIDPADYHVLQVKEKFGELCYYDSGHGDAAEQILNKYENLSRCTCCMCGKPARYISLGWIEPWCEECKEMEEKKRDGHIHFRTLNQEEREECGIC